jgi:hypothetical protein
LGIGKIEICCEHAKYGREHDTGNNVPREKNWKKEEI